MYLFRVSILQVREPQSDIPLMTVSLSGNSRWITHLDALSISHTMYCLRPDDSEGGDGFYMINLELD